MKSTSSLVAWARRGLSTSSRTKLQDTYIKLRQSAEGRQAIAKYGECLERQVDDVRRDCCRVEFQELMRLAEKQGKE